MSYSDRSIYELLEEASRGRIGFDRRLIHIIVDRGDAAVPDLLKFGLEDRSGDPIGLELDLIQVFRILRTEKAVPFYVQLVRLAPYDLPDELVEAFCEIGAPAVEPLLALYAELEEEESGEVAFLLAAIGARDDRVLEILTERLHYDAWDGAILLGMYADPAARPAIEKLLASVPDDAENEQLRRDLTRALGELGRDRVVPEAPTMESLVEEYPEEALPEFDILPESDRLALLASDDADERLGAAQSFANWTLTDATRQRLLNIARTDSEPAVRGAAWRALSAETENDETYQAMLSRVAGEDVPVEERTGALVGLAPRFDEKTRKYAEVMYEQPETRAAALEAMRRSLDRSFAPYFPKHLEDEDLDIKRQAIWGVGYLGITDSAEKLKPFFDDEELRTDALFAYALSTRAETTRGRMKGLLRKIDELAGGLAEHEEELVKTALDERLWMYGLESVFFKDEEHVHGPDCDHDHPGAEATPPPAAKVGRNDPCPCGSGKKYKKCCGA